MNKFKEFLEKNFNYITIGFLFLIFLRTCNSENKSINKRLDRLTDKIDSLQSITVTKNNLQIEGLKAEKRMIQSTDRTILDVNRQSEIDKEIERLSK